VFVPTSGTDTAQTSWNDDDGGGQASFGFDVA
jgi:hypothetical protein